MNNYRYRAYQHRSAMGLFGPAAMTVALLLMLAGIFAVAVYWFRSMPTTMDDAAAATALLHPTPFSQASGIVIQGKEEAKLISVPGAEEAGSAWRHFESGVYFHEIIADLPAIDREAFAYEAWLVRSAPFDYFKTGEMVTNDLGQFILKFEGDPRGAYEGYAQVVITLEPKDGNPDPGEHVAEGKF